MRSSDGKSAIRSASFGAIEGPQLSRKHGKLRRMYYNALMSFNPMIASVGAVSEKNGLESARQACNAAIMAALGSREPMAIRENSDLCEVYWRMKYQGENRLELHDNLHRFRSAHCVREAGAGDGKASSLHVSLGLFLWLWH